MARSGRDIRFLAVLMLLILSLLPGTEAHSGVERLMRIAPNGTMIGPEGFPRGFWPRTAPGYYDNANYHLADSPNDKLIHPFQRSSNYTNDKYPRLKAAPGDMVALQYQENGHTTLPDGQKNKPKNRGTVFIYGTFELSPDYNLFDVHYKWNEQGTGGDGKGKLIATRNFDDGRCHENNGHALALSRKKEWDKPNEAPMEDKLWCQNDVALPADLPVGKQYTLVWVWDWPIMDRPGVAIPPSSAPGAPPSAEGAKVETPELYTTAMDINIVDPCGDELGEVKGPTCGANGGNAANTKYVVNVIETDYNKAAIPEQVSNMFLVDVSALIDDGNGNANDPAVLAPSSGVSLPTGTTSSSIYTKSGKPHVKTTTATTGASQVTTTITEKQTAPTAAVTAPEITPGLVLVTVTVTTYDTTVTVTVPPSSSATSATTPAISARPTVTGFYVKDSKPTTTTAPVNKGRRALGQWGFGADVGRGGQRGA